MRVMLCALTGMGNAVLQALLGWGRLSELAVLTRAEAGPFPHYPCGQLDELCRRRGVPCRSDLRLADETGARHVADFAPDILLAATFHQRIPGAVVGLASSFALNAHSSLLPAHRGPTPTNWAILAGEEFSGVSFHQLAEGLDQGAVYHRARLAIGGMTDGELRRELSVLAARELPGVLDGILDGRLAPQAQDESLATCEPKVGSEEGLALIRRLRPSPEALCRATTPLPGPEFLARAQRALAEAKGAD